jgi:quercetin dioxygenase-like cupin family protein
MEYIMDNIAKIALKNAEVGPRGQYLLAQGDDLQMRVWKQSPDINKEPHANEYEVAGFVLEGRARLRAGENVTELTAGDSWVVPAGVEHQYEILEPFATVEVVG